MAGRPDASAVADQDHRRRDPGPASLRGRRQGPVHQGARHRASRRRDRSRGPFRQGPADRAAGRHRDRRLPAARGCARRLHQPRLQKHRAICPKAASWAPRRCDGRRRSVACGRICRSRSCAATCRRGCQARTRRGSMPRCSPWPDLRRLGLTDHVDDDPRHGRFSARRRPGRDRHHHPGRRRRRRDGSSSRSSTEPTGHALAAERAFLDRPRRLLPHADRRTCAADRRRARDSRPRAASRRVGEPSRSHGAAPSRTRRRSARRRASTCASRMPAGFLSA